MKKTHTSQLLAVTLASILLFTSFQLQAQAQAENQEPLPDNVPALLVKANEAYAAKDYLTFRKVMQALNSKRPNNSDYMYQLVIAYALLDEKRSAYDLMLRMQQQGLAYDFSNTDSTENIRNTEVFDYVNDLMKMAGQPVGESEEVFTLPANVIMPEAISWDESRQKFLVGTVAEGSIFAVGEDGEVNELLRADQANGMWAVFDILVDTAHNRLWVTSAASPKFARLDPPDKGRSALFEFNLETLELLHRYPVPVDGRPHSLGSMALSPNGDMYIVDRALPIVYTKPAGERKLKALLATREMVSMRGIAMQPDGRIMYVADRELGIMVVDLEAGKAGKLVVPENFNIGGIEGLYLWENHLIVIQNGISPQRVMRLELDTTGIIVNAVRPLAVAQPEFDFPSYGAVRGKDLFYFSHSQWSDKPGQLKPVKVLRTGLDSNSDLEQPDMQEYLRQRAEQLEAKKSEKE